MPQAAESDSSNLLHIPVMGNRNRQRGVSFNRPRRKSCLKTSSKYLSDVEKKQMNQADQTNQQPSFQMIKSISQNPLQKKIIN